MTKPEGFDAAMGYRESEMVFAFGDCELDVGCRELRRAGKSVPVEPQVFDLLVHLVKQRDRVVGKDELFHIVWKDRIVSESTLTSRISAARRAIGIRAKPRPICARSRAAASGSLE